MKTSTVHQFALTTLILLLSASVVHADGPPSAGKGSAPKSILSDYNSPAVKSLPKGQQDQMKAEEAMGSDAVEQIAKTEKFVTDPVMLGRVQAIGAKLAAVADRQMVAAGFGTPDVYPFHYVYHIINKKEINAFALPGGNIYIYKGLLDQLTTDDEIAGVLGHETAHAAHHHISMLIHQQNKMSGQLALATLAAVLARVPMQDIAGVATGAQYAQAAVLNNRYSESAEEDADHTGMIYMQKAGYNPVGMLALLRRLKEVEDRSPDVELGFLRDHPLTSDRLMAARAELASLKVLVDTHTLRAASGTMLANVVDVSQGTPPQLAAADVKVGSLLVFRVAGTDKQRASSAAGALNTLLDNNLQLYEVRASGSELIVRETPLISFTEADAQAQSVTPATKAGQTPQQLATAAAASLRNMLWSQSVTSASEQQIDVAGQVSAMP